jgi:HEPN domain-containing protein
MKPRERFPHDDPREWMNRAHSNLARAKLWAAGVYLEDLCFDAQQAAEKAIKGLLPARGVQHPFIHDLAALLSLVEEAGVDVPAEVFDAATLTRYAAVTRYPGHTRPVTDNDHREAVKLADRVVRWVEGIL